MDVGKMRLNELLENSRAELEVRHEDAAARIGVDPTVVLAIVRGEAQLPLELVPRFAQELRADPADLLFACLEAYAPETFAAIEQRLEGVMTRQELSLIKELRRSTQSPFVVGFTKEQQAAFDAWVNSMRQSQTSTRIH